MKADTAWLLLPEALKKPSFWSGYLRRRALRSHVKMADVVLGAGRPWPWIENNAGGRMTLGNIFLAAGSRLWSRKGAELTIGDGTVLDAGAEIIAFSRVVVGRNCYFGWDALVMDTDLHSQGAGCPVVNRPVTIGEGVRIGARAIILKGVTIGDGVIIHPGSIVTHDVQAGAEVRASPAEVKKVVLGQAAASHA